MAKDQAQRGLIVERIMRDREGIWRQVVEERGLASMTFRMFVTSLFSLAVYGAVLGASHSAIQAASSAIKLPLLFLATLAICLPTLYLFNLIFGARLGMMQAVVLIMTCITVISVLALAFAPISLFFLITANNYEFIKLLNVAILVLSALVGLRFLTSGMAALNTHQERLHAEREHLAFEVASAAKPAEVVLESNSGGGTTAVSVLPKAPPVATVRLAGSSVRSREPSMRTSSEPSGTCSVADAVRHRVLSAHSVASVVDRWSVLAGLP
jgi:hypothetical protein